MHSIPALLQKSHYGIHRRPCYLRKQNQEHAFVVLPCRFPYVLCGFAWLGHGLLPLSMLCIVVASRHLEANINKDGSLPMKTLSKYLAFVVRKRDWREKTRRKWGVYIFSPSAFATPATKMALSRGPTSETGGASLPLFMLASGSHCLKVFLTSIPRSHDRKRF
jgi:hypothetical protein